MRKKTGAFERLFLYQQYLSPDCQKRAGTAACNILVTQRPTFDRRDDLQQPFNRVQQQPHQSTNDSSVDADVLKIVPHLLLKL
jgi:hypothetical protein